MLGTVFVLDARELQRSRLEAKWTRSCIPYGKLAEDLVRNGVARQERCAARVWNSAESTAQRRMPRGSGVNLLDSLLQDLRHTFPNAKKESRFTLITVLTLALGIGANTAIFAL